MALDGIGWETTVLGLAWNGGTRQYDETNVTCNHERDDSIKKYEILGDRQQQALMVVTRK